MPTYRLRLVAEAGPDPVDGTPLGHDEETLTVEADSPWAARSRALHRMTLRPMGRVLRAYDADTGDEIVHPPPAGFRPGRFTIDGLPGTYDGFTRGETWNGFAVPYFPLAVARRVADDYAAQPAGLDGQPESEYDADRDLVRLYDPSSGEWDEYGPVEIDDRALHGPRALYPVGARYWTWEEGSARADSATC
ncbi:MAG TPA: hypothetical protein EYQ24_04125 [Bacteroidetes bacterium]|nr:hypothetical protein [Bacteroidota bacterium]